jgi:nucleotide-binding universal stress UspA family protein
MIELRRILCPVDFSESSRRALDFAVALARHYGSSITVLHAYSTTPVAAYAPGLPVLEPLILTEGDRQQLHDALRAFAAEESDLAARVEILVREGMPARVIVDEADPIAADLLVMGTHGRSGFDRLVLGSVTERVLRKARVPVLTVPPHRPDAAPAGPRLFTSILCPIDFSECSLHALDYAASLAQQTGAALTVMHVMSYQLIETPVIPDRFLADGRLTLSEYCQVQEEDLRRRVTEAAERAAQGRPVTALLAHGQPGPEVLRTAAAQKSDLIVMGVHGRGAVDLMLFGSTTHRVVREAVCPVLTVRQK